MRTLVLIGLLMALLFASFNVFSFDHITRVAGVVAAISADFITLDNAENMRDGMTIGVMRSTLFIQDGQSVSWRDLKIGAQADVDVTGSEPTLYAIDVVFEKPPARGHTGSSPARELRSYHAHWQLRSRGRFAERSGADCFAS
jgi:hypothetical protein